MEPITVGMSLLRDIIGLFPTEASRNEALAKLQEYEASMSKAQTDVNAKEAESSSGFVAGWRPFVGWVCGAGFTYSVVLQPLLSWLCAGLNVVVPPSLNSDVLMAVLGGMLGLGGMRSFEKVKLSK